MTTTDHPTACEAGKRPPALQFALYLLPVVVFGVILAISIPALSRDQSVLPSNLIDKAVPAFELTDMPGLGEALSPDDLKGEVSLVNVFGSWCRGCRVEHPLLVEIQNDGEVPLHGINWADTPERGAAWLSDYGNAYDRVGNDEAGRAVIGFGVTGAPETFVIDAEGRIRYRHAGPITRQLWEQDLKPLVKELQRQATASKS